MSRTIFHGPKDVRAIAARLYTFAKQKQVKTNCDKKLYIQLKLSLFLIFRLVNSLLSLFKIQGLHLTTW